ncbi:MAG: TIM-barrel domain-containing protein [Elusimicrobiota bacterium]
MLIKKIQEKPVQYLVSQNYRLTLYSSSLVRVEFSKKGLFDDENPLILEPSFGESVSHKIRQTKKFFILSTDYFELKLMPDGRQFDIGNLYFRIRENSYTWQPGIIDTQNVGGAMLDLYKFPEGKYQERFTDGLISKNGYFVFRNHCEFLWDTTKNWIKRKSDWAAQDWYLFGYGSDYKKAFSDFVKLFGKIPLVPKWVFGYWYSRWYKFKDTDILDVIKKLKDTDIPIDVFVIDTDWRGGRKGGSTWNGYEWNKELFPNPQAFIQELKRQNIHTCLNDHPGYGQSDELPQSDTYREKIKARIPDINEYRIRWSDKRYVYSWLDEIFTKFLKDGIDFWWVDGWGATDMLPDLSSQQWVNKWYFESAKRTGTHNRPLILSRWGGLGSHKYPVQFSGDTHSSYDTLKYQISFTHKGGNIGAAYWSHDIGGFLGDSSGDDRDILGGNNTPSIGKISDELFIRWLQFGCFAPVLRTHSSGASRNIWDYSEDIIKIFRKYLKIRYALFPYFYRLARECYDTGMPLIRGLYLEYPDDENAYLNDDEYLIGNSILVAPAYGPGNVFEREVYFPKGNWIPLESGSNSSRQLIADYLNPFIKGPCKKRIKIPIDKIPVYIKLGSIISTYPIKQNLSNKPTEIEFNIFPEISSRQLIADYYEDDGLTQEYLKRQFLTQKISVLKSKKETKIEIFPVVGSYTDCPKEISYKLNVFWDKKKLKSVFVNNAQKEIKYTQKIFSGTVVSFFTFLQLELGHYSRDKKIEIIIK